MTTPFKLDHDELARCALGLREAMLAYKDEYRDSPYVQRIIDQELEHLDPVLNLCIAKELEEPFPMLSYVNPRIFGDVLAFDELTKPYYELVHALYGGMTHEEFWASEYGKERRLPRQLRKPPEYVPSPDTLRKI